MQIEETFKLTGIYKNEEHIYSILHAQAQFDDGE